MRFDLTLWLAIAAVWFIWGSTFAGMHLAVATIPPFIMAGSRFCLAGAILYAISAARGQGRFSRTDLLHAVVCGTALLLFGNGITAYTVQFLPTGVNALLLSIAPIWMAIIAFVWGRERPSSAAVVGMALGFAGLVLLLRPHAGATLPFWPAALAIFVSFSWAFGSVYSRRRSAPGRVGLTTSLQMLAGGALILMESGLTGEWRTFDVHAISAASLAGFAWLVVFGSIIAYSAYQYTMHAVNTALGSTYAYVNPVVSVVLGYVLFGERLTPLQAAGGAVMVVGVALMMWPVRPVQPAPRSAVADDALAARG